ncbi:hypothetical protein HPC49_08405 [Pyxidicoccus fallax]|uniref:Uncharacterized protein n=1 Tax=Pyxidicoccus fallax TaxID=394095 RepID=A0A848LB46_9BACT|nr:hypothetical protein [Pyxidicoccus fallax]NMO13913.1 hypothetical protein [Pyxidicoccus fallax]NPC78271.1 hypothetical protein [Pyxidicoccus fallax]
MRPSIFLLFCFICLSGRANAQVFGGEAFERILAEQRLGQPVLLNAEKEIGKRYNILLLTATLPVGFTELRVKDGEAILGNKLEIGGGAALMIGKGIYNGDGNLTLSPMVMLGAALNAGVGSGESDEVKGRFGISGFLGLGPIAFSIGRDFISGTTYYGLSARIDAFVLGDDAFIPFAVW